MSDTRWMLRRGTDDPLVWPFDSHDEAVDWAGEHGLVDYVAQPMADRDEHEEVCARCREPWPCRHVRLDRKAARLLRESRNRCARCGEQIGWMTVTLKGAGDFGEDVRFHGRKGACKNEALRRLRALGTPEAAKELRRIEEQDDYNRRLREVSASRKAARV